jgi:small subunit ribosomal protein S8
MAMTDPLGDMLTRIRNGQQARKDFHSDSCVEAACAGSRCASARRLHPRLFGRALWVRKGLRIELKYFEGQPAIQHLARISKPGRRVYSAARELPRIRNGLGTVIVSTPRGVLSDAEAREQNVGGEVLAEVF